MFGALASPHLPRGRACHCACLAVRVAALASPRLPRRACRRAYLAARVAALALPRMPCSAWCPATACIALASRRSAHPAVLSGCCSASFACIRELALILAALTAMLDVLASLAL